MNEMELPEQFLPPPKEKGLSVLVSSYNTKGIYIQECLESIKNQIGYFNIELVWINDGSDKLHTTLLKKYLDNFIKTTRFITLVYEENDENKGIGYSLNKGVHLCSYDLIVKMDSDDIMVNNRIQKQIEFMELNPDIMICGSQLNGFKDNINNVSFTSNHPIITWEQYKEKPSHWFVNHPTLCYRKKAVLEAGNYDKFKNKMIEDFDLELRMLKKFGVVYNLSEALLYYRLHDKQVTHNGGTEGRNFWSEVRLKLISDLINS